MPEQTVEIKNCKNCGIEYFITDKDVEFYDKISPIFDGKKYQIPTPTHCPECRQQRRMVFRNERKFYKRNSDLTGKPIVSIYSPDKNYVVYDQKQWWSDHWNPMDYGIDYDFNRLFFEQFNDMSTRVPKLNFLGFANENCDYTNYLGNSKNSYLTVAGVNMENVLFSFRIANCQVALDCYKCFDSTNIYGCIDTKNCHNSLFLENCHDCRDSISLKDCIGCVDCIACKGLHNKQYYIFNKPYTKEEYTKIKLQNYMNFQDYNNHVGLSITKCLNNINCENCVGDYLIDCKNAFNCYDSQELIDCKNISFGWNMNSCYEIDYDSGTSNTLESLTGFNLENCRFVNYCNESSCLFYCSNCFYCNNCFGCEGLKNKSYCILNKQYDKKDYEELVPQIINHMNNTKERGEYFPINISPFDYNETVVMEYYPMDKNEVISKGYNWQIIEYPINVPETIKTIEATELPRIEQLNVDIGKQKDILNKAIICEKTGRPFRIVKPELDFYIKHSIKLATIHPNIRHQERLARRQGRKLQDRKCNKCGVDIKTTLSPEISEIVYCEQCYEKEIY